MTVSVVTDAPPMALEALVAILEAIGLSGEMGAGSPSSPLFPVPVQLNGRDGNAVSIITRVERAVREWLREATIPREYRDQLRTATRRHLLGAASYDDLLWRVQCLVDVH